MSGLQDTRRGLDLKWSLEDARQALGLAADLPVLLVFGGSQGSRSINRALLGALPDLLSEMQVIHISGWLDWAEVEFARSALAARSAQDAALLDRYRAFPYLHDEMGAAFTVADLALSRAGASTLGEFPLCGLPAILVPYPHAWRYQRVDADYLAENGAALVIEDVELPERILPVVRGPMRELGTAPADAAGHAFAGAPLGSRNDLRVVTTPGNRSNPGKDVSFDKHVDRLLYVCRSLRHDWVHARLGQGVAGHFQRGPGTGVHFGCRASDPCAGAVYHQQPGAAVLLPNKRRHRDGVLRLPVSQDHAPG